MRISRRVAWVGALALLVAAAGPRARAAGAIRMVTVGSDSVSSPAPGSLRKVLLEVQPGDTIQFAQNFSIVLDRKDPTAILKLAQSGVTIQGPAELRSGLIIFLGDGTTVTGMRFADFRVFAGTLHPINPDDRTADFVFTGNTLVGDSGLQMTLMSNALVQDNTFDVRPFHGDNAVSDYRSDGSLWTHNTWTDTSQGGFEESECKDLVFAGSRVVGDSHFGPRSGAISGNDFSNGLIVNHADFSIEGPVTVQGNRCGALSAHRPSLEVLDNTVTGEVTGKWKVTPFSVNGGDVTGDSGFVRVVGNTITATQGWIAGAIVGATSLAPECLVSGNTVTGGKLRSLLVYAGKTALVVGNTVHSGGKLAAIAISGAAVDGFVLQDNVVDGGLGAGIQIAKGTGTVSLAGNTVTNCRNAALDVSGLDFASEDGVYRDCGTGVKVGKKTTGAVRGGAITGNRGTGLYADSGSAVEVARVSFGGNGGAGIDLAPGGVTPNTKKKTANGNMPYPESLEWDAQAGRAKGKAEPLARIDAYAVEDGPRAGNPQNGEGATWLGEVAADANGDFTFPASGRLACPPSKKVTFTATRQGDGIDPVTSEFSLDVDCGGPAISLVSQSPAGAAGDVNSGTDFSSTVAARLRTVSDDGRFVVFQSHASNLVPGDTNGLIDVFLRDTVLGTTVRVNRDRNGAQIETGPTMNGSAGNSPSISADGRFVVFSTHARSVFLADVGGFNDDGIVLFDTQAGTNTIVVDPSSAAPPPPSGVGKFYGGYQPSLSGDGSAIAFWSIGRAYTAGDIGDDADVFLWTRSSGAFERLSIPTGGGDVTNGSFAGYATTPRLSYDARYAVFGSRQDLSGMALPLADRAWLRDRQAGTTEAVSIDSAGVARNGTDPWVSDDGRFVAFASTEALVPADTNGKTDVYLRDRQSATTTLVSAHLDGTVFTGDSYEPSLSGDGRFVTFKNFGDIWLLDRQAVTLAIASGGPNGQSNSASGGGRLSRTGQFLVFESDATNLVDLGGVSFITQVYLRDISQIGK